LHRALDSEHAPRWEQIPAQGVGYQNDDRDGFNYGSSQLVDVITDAGLSYSTNHLAQNPTASPLSLNDASKRNGGPNNDHASHQNGLDLDLRLPRTDGESGTQVGWRNYDSEATYQMLRAFAEDPRTERVIFGDRALI